MDDSVGVDIGGSLIKFACKSECRVFDVESLEEFLEFLVLFRERQQVRPAIFFTGGGAVKYHERIALKLRQDYKIVDEMECIVRGVLILAPSPLAYPFLIVNIGSGISILCVESPGTYRRVSGSALGGSSLRGLAYLIAGVHSFPELIAMAGEGTNDHIDLLVGDIYGTDYDASNLPAEVVAGYFGKVFPKERVDYSREDLVFGVLQVICENIAQISFLCASIQRTKRIYFTGGLLEAEIVRKTITGALGKFSSELDIICCSRSVFVGAIGAKSSIA